MTRNVPEWIGATPDTSIPMRVQLRVLERQGGRCNITNHKFRPGDKKELDHIIALANGGENRETNLQWILATVHKDKTAKDVAQKSKDRRVRAKHEGLKSGRKSQFPGAKDSRWKRKVSGEWVQR